MLNSFLRNNILKMATRECTFKNTWCAFWNCSHNCAYTFKLATWIRNSVSLSFFFLIILEVESVSVDVFMFWSFCFSFCGLHICLNRHLSLWYSPQCYWCVSILYVYRERLNPITLTRNGYLSASGPHFSFRTRLFIYLLFVKLRRVKAINYNYLWMFPGQINQPNTCSSWKEFSNIGTHTWMDFDKLSFWKQYRHFQTSQIPHHEKGWAMFNIYFRTGLWEFMLLLWAF